MNESKLIALKENQAELDESSIIKAIRHFHLKGISKDNITLSEKEKETISIHEAGHAIVGHYFANKKISEISICPTTSGAGLTEGKHCSVCNTVTVAQTTVKAKGHSYVNDICENCNTLIDKQGAIEAENKRHSDFVASCQEGIFEPKCRRKIC